MKMRNYLRLILYAISFGYQVYAQERISFRRQLENVKEETAALKQQMGEVTISLNNQLKEETTALRNQLTEETTILRNQLTEETTTLRNRVRELERLNDQKIQKDSARVKQIEDNLNVVIKVVKREFGKDLLIDVANIDDSENTQVDKLEIKMVKVQKFLKNEFGEVFIEQPSKFDELTIEKSTKNFNCTSPVLINPPETSRSYKSVYGNSKIGAGYARSMIDSPQGWSAKNRKAGEWMTIDLGSDLPIGGLAIQSRKDRGQYVTSFRVKYWKDGETVENGIKVIDDNFVFTGYENLFLAGEYNEVLFEQGVVGRYFKIIVETWKSHPSMRAGALECPLMVFD